MTLDLFERAHELSHAGQAFAVATVVRAEKPTSAKPGSKAIVTADGRLSGWVGGSCAQPTVIRESLRALHDGEPRLLRLCPPESMGLAPQEGVIEVVLACASGGTLEIHIEPYLPRPQLIAIGHLPVVEALATLGKGVGYAVTVMALEADGDRFSQADRFLDRLDWLQVDVTAQTYIVVASHGNYDEEALEGALKTGAPYVALVASRKRAAAVMQSLRDAGLSEEQLARIKCPAGLDLGARTPEEIALSVLAEIVQLRRRAPSLPLDSHPLASRAGQEPAEAVDPVCGMSVEVASARHTFDHRDQTYYFCSAGCRRSFAKEPAKYVTENASSHG